VFIHSSIDQLHPDFPFYRLLPLIQQITGPQGTVLFPTYPQSASYEFLSRGEIFDVRKTPSYTGILTEFARRQRSALRSLHPTKSVCAIGLHAHALTATHQLSPYPYDACSPYKKITEYDGKLIGLGVTTANLSFVHCADDALKDDFPVRPYHNRLFEAECINYEGQAEIVRTYAHDMRKMNHNIPRFMKRHIPPEICRDIKLQGRPFFRADASQLFALMTELAQKGITIYPRSAYDSDRTRK
ncbi:MAG TPA: AAC(3) family N-acetyltransferase, partial [Pyrinomonadaceae bacterium]|nr:AAC(3) family N-acetyltransferase [Pyrinomonadaceae bacterium]